MGYCDGLCPHLDSKKHKCRQTGERLGYIKGWWGVTYEHHGFADCDKKKDLEGVKVGYCNGLCPYLDSKKHKCRQTGERLGYIKGWWV